MLLGIIGAKKTTTNTGRLPIDSLIQVGTKPENNAPKGKSASENSINQKFMLGGNQNKA